MKKILSLVLVLIAMTLTINADNTKKVEIPGEMAPKSIIEFDENLNIVVIDKGDASLKELKVEPKNEPLDLSKMSKKQKEAYLKEQELIKQVELESKNYPVYEIKYYAVAGMRVIYDSEGFIDEIIYPEPKNISQPYLSFSYTTYDDIKDPLADTAKTLYYYNIDNDKLKILSYIPSKSLFPLEVYSKRDNKIYYSSMNEKGRCDDLYSLDLKTYTTEKLTDGVKGIETIIPREKDIVMLSMKENKSGSGLVKYDKNSKQVTYDNEDSDIEIQTTGVNANNPDEFYTATYSLSESEANIKDQDKTGEIFYYTDHTLNKYTGELSSKKKILYYPKQKITSISANDKSILLTKHSNVYEIEKTKLVKIDKSTGTRKELELDDISARQIELSPDDKGIYFLGSYNDSNEIGIYYYDFETKEAKLIFKEEIGVGQIDDFRVMYE